MLLEKLIVLWKGFDDFNFHDYDTDSKEVVKALTRFMASIRQTLPAYHFDNIRYNMKNC